MQLPETTKILAAAPPQSYANTAMTAFYVSMKNYNRLTIIIQTGAWAGGTAAVTLTQAVNVAAGTPLALGFTWMWTGTAASGALTKTAVAANTFNLAVANSLYVIEVPADSLAVATGHDCLTLAVASPGANADFYSVTYVLSEPRYAEATPPSAIIN